jgi:hypothetical protein
MQYYNDSVLTKVPPVNSESSSVPSDSWSKQYGELEKQFGPVTTWSRFMSPSPSSSPDGSSSSSSSSYASNLSAISPLTEESLAASVFSKEKSEGLTRLLLQLTKQQYQQRVSPSAILGCELGNTYTASVYAALLSLLAYSTDEQLV